VAGPQKGEKGDQWPLLARRKQGTRENLFFLPGTWCAQISLYSGLFVAFQWMVSNGFAGLPGL